MRRSVKLGWSSLKVGILVLVVIAITIWASFTGGGTSIFEDKKEFVAYFQNVDGLLNGSPVWVAGVNVGNVNKIEFVWLDSLRQIRVTAEISERVWPQLTTGSEALLGSIGFLGDKYVEVIPTGEGERLEPGGVIRTRDAGTASAVFAEAEEAAATAGNVLSGIDTMLTRINRGEGTFGKMATEDQLYVRLTNLTANLSRLTASLQGNQERIVSSIEKLSTSVTNLSEQVQTNSGTLGKIMNDPQLYDNLATTTARLDTVLAQINSAEGSLGLMVSDTAFYVETVNLMTRMNNLLTDMQANPKKYFKFSVF